MQQELDARRRSAEDEKQAEEKSRENREEKAKAFREQEKYQQKLEASA